MLAHNLSYPAQNKCLIVECLIMIGRVISVHEGQQEGGIIQELEGILGIYLISWLPQDGTWLQLKITESQNLNVFKEWWRSFSSLEIT